MPLDPSILAQGKPFQTPDPLQNYAKVLQIQNAQNQNALAQYQLGTAKRGEEGQNALSRAQQAAYDPETGTYDMNKLRGSMISGGFGALLPDAEKKMGELRTQQLAQQKAEGEVVVGRTKQFRDLLVNVNNPSAAAQWLQAQYKDPFLGPVVSRMPLDQALAEIPTDPVKFDEWRSQNALGMEEFIKQNKPTTFETGTGQVKQRMSVPGLGGAATVVPGSTMQQVPTPGERMTDARMREKMAQDKRQFEAQQTGGRDIVAQTLTDAAGNVTQYNKFGEQIGETKKGVGKPSATFEKTEAAKKQLSRDISRVIPELENITKEGGLIDQSTGSGVGRLADISAGFIGQATPGAIAIGKLKPIADTVLKMVPRFEGPQSDKDTQSYKEAAGQLADSAMPTKIRKAAALEVLRLMKARKDQFATLDMVEPPVATPNIDALLDKYK